MGDGQQANNPWLQEFPDPITRVTWDNYLTVSSFDAKRIGLKNIPLSASVSGSQDQDKTTSAHVVAIPTLTSPRLLIGSDRTLAGANVAHDVAVTRVFNRALSDSEVFQNFISTIPSNILLDSFKIG